MSQRTDVPKCRPFFSLVEPDDNEPEAARLPEARPPRQEAPDPLAQTWTVPDLCEAYDWPQTLEGGGVIGILAMGGGYERSDLEAYFGGIAQPMPVITDVTINGAGNRPNQPTTESFDPDVEIALDIEVAASAYYVATGKPATVRVYWTDMDLRSMALAIGQAAADGCSVFSISWGAPEDAWQMLYAQLGQNVAVQLEAELIHAASLGMTVFAAAGDLEANAGEGRKTVNLPAGCPHAVGCGGTSKTRGLEVVWNDDPGQANGTGTGGGYSSVFLPQAWMTGAPAGGGRMVPDVAGNADKQTGYRIYVHGKERITGGTSAVAPLFAGLFAAFGKTGRGFVNPTLWANRDCFRDITQGNNDGYDAAPGPDPCSGIGVPIAQALATLFEAVPVPTAG